MNLDLVRDRAARSVADVRIIGGAGFVGTVLMAIGAARIGAGRTSDAVLPARLPPPHAPLSVAAYATGFSLLMAAWLLLGHEAFRSRGAVAWRTVRRVSLAWMLPLLVSAPIGSRDLWAYAAQGNEVVKGFDPYRLGPGVASGAFNQQVTARWLVVPSPYGPLWLSIGRIVRLVMGGSPLANVVVLRLFAALGVVMLAWTLPALAQRLGGSPSRALWAVVANPLFLVHGVAGGHNDMLMCGLTSLGLYVATSALDEVPALAAAGALVGLAGSIKVTALVAVIFVPLVRLRMLGVGPLDVRRAVRGTVVAGLSAVVAIAIVNLASGLSLGWIKQASAQSHGGGPVRLILMIAIVVFLWQRAFTWNPVTMLACAYAAVIFITPVSEWWYWCWPFAVGAIVIGHRLAAGVLAGISISLLMIVGPNGEGVHLRIETIVVGALLAAWLVFDRTWRPMAGLARTRSVDSDASAR